MVYPIKFVPRLKERIWGGHELLAKAKEGKAKKIDPAKPYGESWELSAVEGDISVVANGMLKRNNREEIIEVYMGNLIGEKVYDKYGLTFPLLIKSLDCHDVLSVQVHRCGCTPVVGCPCPESACINIAGKLTVHL